MSHNKYYCSLFDRNGFIRLNYRKHFADETGYKYYIINNVIITKLHILIILFNKLGFFCLLVVKI